MPDDPFSLLSLPASFDLDEADIERSYLTRIAQLHPDLVGSDPDAAASAAMLNDARTVLLDPEQRAHALLARLGVSGPDTSLPDGFLFEIMDVRTQLEQAAGSKNADELQKWTQWASDRRAGYIAEVRELFQELGDQADSVLLARIRTTLNAWRYIQRMIQQIGLTNG